MKEACVAERVAITDMKRQGGRDSNADNAGAVRNDTQWLSFKTKTHQV